MPSLLVSVFVLQLVIHLINTVGVATINALLWNIFNRLPTPTAKGYAEQKRQQKEYLALKLELNATSSQDEFAKWAKLRRQHDKLLEQLEKTKASLDSSKAIFDRTISALRWLGTTGLRTLMQFWFSKEPMFWLPYGWVPYYGEWLLSFPRAPLGSISIQAWALACASIIALIGDAVVAIIGLASRAGAGRQIQPEKRRKEEPVKAGSTQGTGSEKKEL